MFQFSFLFLRKFNISFCFLQEHIDETSKYGKIIKVYKNYNGGHDNDTI